ncbi:AgmX/PglI C-terminal domain-containing protein [Microbulbifer sp. TYP-18]|uniref:AgmX/PglI C-terminal domain-containing protein n=1 Tax=Microbulbifer sp. TYP-18 TaxID=3230024 RepID=UPI0034C5CBFF
MSNFLQQRRVLSDEQEEVRRRVDKFAQEQRQLDARLAELEQDGEKQQLLGEISARLSRLEDIGAGELFWGPDYRDGASRQLLQRLQHTVEGYQDSIGALRERRQWLRDAIAAGEEDLFDLDEQAQKLQQEEQEAQFEFEVTRELKLSDGRISVLPWHTQGDDERRFRRCLLASLLVALLLGWTVPMWTLPEPEDQVIEIPERLAKLVIEKKTKPKPPPKPEQAKPKQEEKKPQPEPEQKVAKQDPKPAQEEKKQARKKAERAGVLAFKDNFQDLIEDDLDYRLGQQTQLSTAGKRENRSQRSLITAAATAGSGGINTAKLSRNVGGSGTALEGVAFARVESAIGSEGDFAGEDRPLSDGVGPSRTDEEIQIVFDRYKAALYRIYNRELRNNPALQGKMVLKITIEPDGSVSLAQVDSSDMDSPALNAKIVARVKRFNFGEKAGVPTITILFPIDFLPNS